MLRIGFIGSGTVGNALAVLLRARDYQVAGVSSRSQTSAENLAQGRRKRLVAEPES